MSEQAPWPTSQTAHIGNVAGGAKISSQNPGGPTPQSTIDQIAAMMDSPGAGTPEQPATLIPDQHAHLAPKSSDIRYPRSTKPKAQMIDPADLNAGSELADLLANGHKIIGLDHYTTASTQPQGKKLDNQIIRG